MKTIEHIVRESYKRIKLVNPDITEGEVWDQVQFLFNEFKREMDKCEHPGIFIKNIGTFALVPSRVVNSINRRDTILNGIPDKQGEKFKSVSEKYDKIMPIFQKVLDYKQTVLNNREEYIKNKYGTLTKNEYDNEES
jgi:hypothetical protein